MSEILKRDLGNTAYGVMTGCDKHGMMNGCTADCPVLIDGGCELMEDENKELHKEAMEEYCVSYINDIPAPDEEFLEFDGDITDSKAFAAWIKAQRDSGDNTSLFDKGA